MTRVFHSAWIGGDGAVRTQGEAEAMFPWWSFTKTVIALAAMRLVEQGRLDLDARRPGKPWSLRQLLSHRAGVPNYGRLAAYHQAVARGEDAWGREALLEAVDAGRLDFEPGQGWSYSNVGYMFAGDAVAEAAGLPLGEALQALVIRPVDLQSPRFAEARADMAEVFWPHLRTYDPRWVYHGLLIGTPLDAARLLHAVFSGGFLSPGALSQMRDRFTRFGGPLPGRPVIEPAYGLGLMVGRLGEAGRAWGHNGAGPGSVNFVAHFPEVARPATVAVFTDGEDEGVAEFEAVRLAENAP
jgi:CubicO group peptidase (beta-lactamase class C family)